MINMKHGLIMASAIEVYVCFSVVDWKFEDYLPPMFKTSCTSALQNVIFTYGESLHYIVAAAKSVDVL